MSDKQLFVYIALDNQCHAVIDVACIIAMIERTYMDDGVRKWSTRIDYQVRDGEVRSITSITSAEQILGLIRFEQEKQARLAVR